jgi:uncharacterized repeat protein (TIGR01451 family)
MKSRVPGVLVGLFAGVLLVSCTSPVAISGPCDVTSNSTITLEVNWMASSAPLDDEAAASLRVGSHAVPTKPQANAEGESMLVMIDVPSGWTVQDAVWSGTINDAPANGTADALETAPYCDTAFVSLRSGYVRRFFKITPGVVMTTTSFGVLQVTYATATLSEGVYHPLAMAVPEDSLCSPGMAFHRVTVGTPELVLFDLASILNADVVVNGSDATQDPLIVTDEVGGFAFLTQSVSDLAGSTNPALPDDGILRGNALEGVAAGQNFPVEVAECLPDIPSAISESSDGDNAWRSTTADDSVTFAVPSRRYAELLLLLTGSSFPPDTKGAELSEVDITLTYDDASTQVQHVLIPFGGLLSSLPPDPAWPVVPMFVMGASSTVPLPYDPEAETAGGTINAVAVSPDPAKRVVSVTLALTPTTGTAAVLEQHVALFAAAGLALADPQADLVAAKQLLSSGPFAVGDNATWRVTVTNQGDGASDAVTLTDALPPSLQYVSATASDGTCSHLGGVVTCTLGVLGAGAVETVDIVTTIRGAGSMTNTASVATAGESDVSNNSGSASLVAGAAALTEIPTLSTFAAAMLIGALALLAAMRMR